MHRFSSSKFIGGHSDVIGGCVTTATIDQWRILKRQQTVTGSAVVIGFLFYVS